MNATISLSKKTAKVDPFKPLSPLNTLLPKSTLRNFLELLSNKKKKTWVTLYIYIYFFVLFQILVFLLGIMIECPFFYPQSYPPTWHLIF